LTIGHADLRFIDCFFFIYEFAHFFKNKYLGCCQIDRFKVIDLFLLFLVICTFL